MLGPLIRGTRVTLRAPTEADLPRLVSWFSDPEVRRFTRLRWLRESGWMGEVPSLEELARWLEETARADGLVAWAIEVDGVVVGLTAIAEIDRARASARTHIVIGDRSLWAHGIATEAIALRTAHAFQALSLDRLWTATAAANVAMRQALLRAGYREVAVGEQWEGELMREGWRGRREHQERP